MSHLRRATLLGYAHGGTPSGGQPMPRPGWAYAADLTPPELIAGYRLHRLRERLVLALCLAGLAVALGFAYGFWRAHQADGAVQQASARNEALQQQRQQYLPVTELQGTLDQVHAELATLLTGDVDVASLLAHVRAATPSGVSIQSATVTVGDATTSPASAAVAPTVANTVGTVQLLCAGVTIDDASRFMDALATVPGIADVLPVSNQAQASGTAFSLTFVLTGALLTHRYVPQPAKGSG